MKAARERGGKLGLNSAKRTWYLANQIGPFGPASGQHVIPMLIFFSVELSKPTQFHLPSCDYAAAIAFALKCLMPSAFFRNYAFFSSLFVLGSLHYLQLAANREPEEKTKKKKKKIMVFVAKIPPHYTAPYLSGLLPLCMKFVIWLDSPHPVLVYIHHIVHVGLLRVRI